MTTHLSDQPIRVALLDLYDGEPNQGIRAISELLLAHGGEIDQRPLEFDHFETRLHGEVPDLSYDVYLSSGGPGSPFDGEDSRWEKRYFDWVDDLWRHNRQVRERSAKQTTRHALFICHSFQLMCRHFELGVVKERRSQSFGIFRVHQTDTGAGDPLFAGLKNPFYAADFRNWQVVEPNKARISALGAKVIAREKIRNHVHLERALMGIRLSPEIAGVQFHPEADPAGMLVHFQKKERREEIVRLHGEEKYGQIIERMKDPAYLAHTYRTIIPNFLRHAARQVSSASLQA
jgi:GMP synthase-like glutamine amidotransferase